jgi:putative secreted protein
MKKVILLLCLLCALPIMAQKKTFTAACLNVDGLPPTVKAASIVNVKLNPEGPQETGTLQMSKLVSQKGWDFFGVSENFNYNTQLMSEIGGIYNTGTYRGAIPSNVTNVVPYLAGNKWFDTDGLNLLWRSNISVSDEAWYLWNKRNGITEDGADQLIAKGFRYYTVRIAAGLEVDVYILHMDAETTPADNAAREIQMTQLVDMILASDNKRPIIIMGDTNCRYTRDNLEGLMFDRINADERFEIRDPWIDFPRGKVMPTLGAGSIMVPDHFDGTNHEAFQTGEVVDKIFYINNKDASAKLTAKSYLHDTDFTWPDGSEISDHYPIVIEFEIENVGNKLTGGAYYLRNVGTGQFLQVGGTWDTQAILSKTGRELTLAQQAAEGVFTVNSKIDEGWLSVQPDLTADNCHEMFVDAGNTETRAQKEWTFTKNDDGYYTITCTHTINNTNKKLAITAKDGIVVNADPNADDPNQLWEVISRDQLIANLQMASETNPIDATFLIKGYRFGRNDKSENDAWNATGGKRSIYKVEDNGSWQNYSMYKLYNTQKTSAGNTSEASITQTLKNIPQGKYNVSCDFVLGNNSGTVTVNGQTIPGIKRENGWGTASVGDVGAAFATGNYRITLEKVVVTDELTITVSKTSTSSSTAVFVDNFELTYLGPTDEYLATLQKVKEAIDDAQSKADEAGLSSYNNRSVVDAYENRQIQGDGTKEIHNTYIALAKAASKQIAIPADMRYAILNNSFERGNLTEWNASQATNAKVVEEEKAGKDGKCLVVADGGSLTYNFEVTMPDGIYELKAMLSNGAKLTAAGKTSAPSDAAGDELKEVSLRFRLSGGTTTVGVTCDGAFAADNFILTRTGDRDTASGYELIELAMSDATERVNAMGSPYNDNWDLSKYQQIIDELSLEGDGTKEFYEIYGLLREQVYTQPNTDGVDYTNAIINPSFEFGTTRGWDTQFIGDTGVRECANETYTMQGSKGTYLFNTWQDGGKGAAISQTISGLPAGHYRVIATIGGDQNNYVFFEVNGQRSEAKKIERAKGIGEDKAFEFDVAEGTQEVTITIVGGNSDGTYNETGGCWYKVDYVRLTRHGDTKVCFFYDRLQRAINRLNALAADLPDKYRKQWDPSDYQDLYDRHINGPSHNNITEEDDPMNGSNGVAEINELYARFRTVVFSQTETGADMSGAIGNQSFELGNLSFWNTTMEPASDTQVTTNTGAYVVDASELDGEYLFNSWQSDKSTPVTQTISTVPAGIYRLTAKVASDPGNRFYLAVNDKPGDVLTISQDKTHFEEISVEFEVTADEAGTDGASITIGLYPSIDGNFNPELTPLNLGPWFKADNFRLQLIGRRMDIKWAMEYPEEGYGTIILPFDANVPEDLEIHSLVKSKPSDALGNETYYQIAELAKRDKILANTPYIVTRKAATTKPEGAPQRRAAAAADENGVYTFSGITTHTQDTYESGFLTGSLVAAEPTDGDRHLMMNDGNLGFILHDNSDGQYKVEPYHAYISRKTKFTDGEGHDAFVSDVYFDEPETTVEWTMETALYGTIILPFDADEPVTQGLIAYEITGLGDDGSYLPKGGTMDVEYQLINLTQVENEIMKAYTPYLLFGKITSEATAAEDDTEEAPRTLTFKGKAADGTGATLENGLLKGVLTSGVQAEAGDFVLTYDNRNKEVFSMAMTPQEIAVNHAYIPQEKATGEAPSLLFFEAPTADDIQSGLQVVAIDSEAIVDVFSIDGITLRTGIEAAEALEGLAPGIYVLRTASGATLKVLKR